MVEPIRRGVMTLPRGVINMTSMKIALPAAITYPIRLSAKTQFVSGVAALVFVNPHVLDASQDQVDFGLKIHHPEALDVDDRYEFVSPHSGARLVAWVRSTDSSQKYLIEFTCFGIAIGSFTLIDGEGGSEVEKLDPARQDGWGVASTRIARTFQGSSEWHWFSLESNYWWKPTACEIRKV